MDGVSEVAESIRATPPSVVSPLMPRFATCHAYALRIQLLLQIVGEALPRFQPEASRQAVSKNHQHLPMIRGGRSRGLAAGAEIS